MCVFGSALGWMDGWMDGRDRCCYREDHTTERKLTDDMVFATREVALSDVVLSPHHCPVPKSPMCVCVCVCVCRGGRRQWGPPHMLDNQYFTCEFDHPLP